MMPWPAGYSLMRQWFGAGNFAPENIFNLEIFWLNWVNQSGRSSGIIPFGCGDPPAPIMKGGDN